MAQRDYVSKKPGRSKKRRSGFAFHFMIAISLIVIALFVTVLYFMTQTKAERKPEPESLPQTQPPEITLPEKPQERWTYLKQLENPDNDEPKNGTNADPSRRLKDHIINTFPVRGAGIPDPDTLIKEGEENAAALKNKAHIQGNWIIQCGAFKNKRNAESLKARIAMAGFDSQIQKNALFRVLIGVYPTQEEAQRVVDQLKESQITNCIVTKK